MPEPVATMAFDPSQELLWTGNGHGRVTSFCGVELRKYTSYKMHPPEDEEVRQILFNDKGVISLGCKSIHMAARRGVPQWNLRYGDRAAPSVSINRQRD